MKCPKCGKSEVKRVKRRWWMRLFPHSRHFRCSACLYTFAIWNR